MDYKSISVNPQLKFALQYKADQEEQFLHLKAVCSEDGLDKYKNLKPCRLKTMVRIIISEGYSAEKAYALSKYGEDIINLLKM